MGTEEALIGTVTEGLLYNLDGSSIQLSVLILANEYLPWSGGMRKS